MKLTWEEAQEKLDRLRDFPRVCAANGVNCGPCRNALKATRELELEHGTVHPDNRAKSSGALAP